MIHIQPPTRTKRQTANFQCALFTTVGAYSLQEGESLRAVEHISGEFDLYVEWGEGSLGKFTAEQINQLAGHQVVQ